MAIEITSLPPRRRQNTPPSACHAAAMPRWNLMSHTQIRRWLLFMPATPPFHAAAGTFLLSHAADGHASIGCLPRRLPPRRRRRHVLPGDEMPSAAFDFGHFHCHGRLLEWEGLGGRAARRAAMPACACLKTLSHACLSQIATPQPPARPPPPKATPLRRQ